MPDSVALIKEINRRVLKGLENKRGELRGQLDTAEQEVARLRRSLETIDSKRTQVLAAEELQIALLESSDGQSLSNTIDDADFDEDEARFGPVKETGKLKARIGDQRYLVLLAIKTYVSPTLDFLVYRTMLPERRVRDAIAADIQLGVLEKGEQTADREDTFRLTLVGNDLVQRFEDYRKSRGLPLQNLPALTSGSVSRSPTDEDDDAAMPSSHQASNDASEGVM